ncbi:chemotaxis protein [Stenotrophomonas sp. 169]|uniref:chemotaxis protein CheB n=1 Tax=Stenotrophomonas sp. 169 TaxID=2770322 RepID=UPI0016623B09|nr:chemotaxis protein CheB [Stenotrophomonas sp. 169]QNR96488.1 chemotaxis protein [Stenotrophomonas sp. 169]
MSVNDVMPPPAVALLAREGAARDRLREALAQADVALVLEEDPNVLDPAALLAVAPQAVVIALEPAVEDALERLDAVLSSPDFTLVFDEAELAARREGWETQRWARHLAAKLHGHRQVLPPGAEVEEELVPEPGLPDTPEQLHANAPLAFHVDEAVDAADLLAGDSLYEPPGPWQPSQVTERDVEQTTDRHEPAAISSPVLPSVPLDHGSWSLLDDEASFAPAARVDAGPPPLPAFDSDRLSLVEMDEAAGPRRGAKGAVVVLAGIGGPDALRRLLAALPARLDVPLLVRMPLDGARYGNLVKQMARVSPLPVELAEIGADVVEGQVYILSDDTAAALRDGGLYFLGSAQGLDLAALPPAHSAVILLSGADLSQVDPALTLAEAGAWVGGQVGEGCYDPAAATAVVAAGMFAGEPQELAQAISARWELPEQGEPS